MANCARVLTQRLNELLWSSLHKRYWISLFLYPDLLPRHQGNESTIPLRNGMAIYATSMSRVRAMRGSAQRLALNTSLARPPRVWP